MTCTHALPLRSKLFKELSCVDQLQSRNTTIPAICVSHCSKLFKEYAIADLSRYKEGRVGLRWRTQEEVVSGRGQFVCGAKVRVADTQPWSCAGIGYCWKWWRASGGARPQPACVRGRGAGAFWQAGHGGLTSLSCVEKAQVGSWSATACLCMLLYIYICVPMHAPACRTARSGAAWHHLRCPLPTRRQVRSLSGDCEA